MHAPGARPRRLRPRSVLLGSDLPIPGTVPNRAKMQVGTFGTKTILRRRHVREH